MPYFFALAKDKNLTLLQIRFYANENPLFLVGSIIRLLVTRVSMLTLDSLKDIKRPAQKKQKDEKSHFYKVCKKFQREDWFGKYFEYYISSVSNDKYLKLYKIKSNLVDYNQDTLRKFF